MNFVKVIFLIFVIFIFVFNSHPWDLDGDGSWSVWKKPFDCDDNNRFVNPWMIEIEYNGLNDDCNLETRDDDLDRDGFNLSFDCDDTDSRIYPGGIDFPLNAMDEDCDGFDNYTGVNILLITIDCLRADHLGFYGYNRSTTPNIDRLASLSQVYLNSYSHVPWTQPSIASLFTSKHPKDIGISEINDVISKKEVMLAEVFKSNGYQTEGYYSHIFFKPNLGYQQGFDNYDGTVLKKGGHIHSIVSSEYLSDRVINRFNAGDITNPFFIWIHYFDPHKDYKNHKGFVFGSSPLDRYDSEIAFTDFHINRIIELLKEKDYFKKTIIVIVADHGEEFNDHGGEGHAQTLYEEVIHIPLIIYMPGAKHKVLENIVVMTDIAPTLVDIAGLSKPEEFDGQTLFEKEDMIVYSENYRNNRIQKGIIEKKYKLIFDGKNNKTELYNLERDPYEKNNIITLEEEQSMKLKNKLFKYYFNKSIEVEKIRLNQETIKILEGLGYLT
jgi:choline-sulfatase